jgi:ABC-2 type transport system permease protein
MNGAAGSIALWARATPTLLRVGAAEAFAYRAEFVVWMFTNTMPLIMLGLWTTVAHEGPFAGYGSAQFVAYYLTAMVVRTVTGSWVVWQMNEEIRTGALSMRLLRPIHPFVTYAAIHVSAIPLRSIVALPVAVIAMLTAARAHLTGDPVLIGVFVVSLAGAWALTYFGMLMLGTLCFWVEKSLAVFDLYLGVVGVMSGYLIPLELMPTWLQSLAEALPFKYMLGYPVELLTGVYERGDALRHLGYQWMWVAGFVVGAVWLWRAGVRRYEAYGA